MNTPEPIHPGEHLAEILDELGITPYRLAKTIGVPRVRINDIVNRRRSITADTALRIGQALGMTPDFWLNLQRMYDLDMARANTDLSAIKAPGRILLATQPRLTGLRLGNALVRHGEISRQIHHRHSSL